MTRALAVLSLALAAALILGGMDRQSAVVTAANERSVAQRKTDITPAERVWMRIPMECQTWIAKCGAGEVCKRRYTCAADLTKRAEK